MLLFILHLYCHATHINIIFKYSCYIKYLNVYKLLNCTNANRPSEYD